MTASNVVESIFLAEAGQGGGDHTVVVSKINHQLKSTLVGMQEGYGKRK